jgi:hypothetical protein
VSAPSPDATTRIAQPPVQRPTATIAGAPVVSWDAPVQVSAGEDFDVTVRMAGGDDLKNLRSQVRYDTSVLQLVSAEAGDILPSGNTALPRLNQIAGVVQFVVTATPEKPARGDGSLMVLHFKALAPNAGTRLSLQLSTVATNGASTTPTNQQPFTIVVAQ